MTISTTLSRVIYSPSGAETDFAVPFPFFDATDLEVVERVTATGAETVKSIGADYTVSGGEGGTGTVTAVSPPPATVQWAIRRQVPRTQEIDYVENDPFPAETHERALDRATAQIQDMYEEVARGLKFTVSDPDASIGEIPSSPTRKGKLLGFDSDTGRPTTYSPDDVSFVTVTASGSTTARPTADRFAEVVNVLDFGAAGDGVADDAPAFALAIAAAGGKELYAPKGTYLLGNAVQVNQSLMMTFAPGTVLKAKAGFNGNMLLVTADGVILRGPGTIDGNRANVTASIGITVASGADDVVIEGLTIRSCKGHGIYAYDNCQRLIVRRNFVTDTDGNGITLQLAINQPVHGVRVEDNVVDRSAENAATIGANGSGKGFMIWGGNATNQLVDPVVRGNRAYLPRNTTYGTLAMELWFMKGLVESNNVADGGTYGLSHAQVQRSSIAAVVCFGNSFVGLELAGCQNCSVVGVFVDGEQIGSTTGVSLSQASGVNPTDNSLSAISVKDVGRALYAANADGLSVAGLTGKPWTTNSSASYYFVNVGATDGFSLTGLNLDGFIPGGSGTKGWYGIFIDTCYRGLIEGWCNHWTGAACIIYANSAVTIDEITVRGNIQNAGISMNGGAVLGENNRFDVEGSSNVSANWTNFKRGIGILTNPTYCNPNGHLYGGNGAVTLSPWGPPGNIWIKEEGGAAGWTDTGWRQLTLDSRVRGATVAYSNFAGGGSVSLISANSSSTVRYTVSEIKLSGPFTNFDAGGDRDLAIQDSSGTTTFCVVPATTLKALSAGRWGDASVPFPTLGDLTQQSFAGNSIVVKYVNGTTDYIAGSLKLIIEYERTV